MWFNIVIALVFQMVLRVYDVFILSRIFMLLWVLYLFSKGLEGENYAEMRKIVEALNRESGDKRGSAR